MKTTRFSVFLALLLGILTITLWWSCQTLTDPVSVITDKYTSDTPAAHTELTATAVSQTQINLSWNAVSGATSYTLSRTGYGAVYTGSATSFSDTGLSCGTGYSYTATASNTGRTSGVSNTASATTDQCTPGMPTMTGGSAVNQSTVNVGWSRGTPYTESGFEIIDYTDHVQGSAGAGATNANVPAFYCGTSNPYSEYIARAYVTTNGRTYYSNWSSNSVNVFADECTPGTPTIGTATATGQTTATVTWARNSPYTESGFEIYQYQPELNPLRGTAIAGATSGSATGLACGTSYRFYVRAYVTTNGRTYTAPGISGITAGATTDQCTSGKPTDR